MPLRGLLGLLCLSLFCTSECLETVVRPDKGSTVTVSTELPLDQCAVCTVSGVNGTETSCHSSVAVEPEEEVKLLFNCSQPIDQAYTVTINRTIECTKDACSTSTIETQPSLLEEFSRTFTWELKAPEKTVVALDILVNGLMETSLPCSDGLQYSVATSKTNSKGQTLYCEGGSMTHLDLLNQAVVSLQVQPKTQVKPMLFQVSAGPLKGRKMVLTVDSHTTVVVSRDVSEPECDVCSVDGATSDCSSTKKTLTNVKNVSLEFSCSNPETMYSVKIKRNIECTNSLCTPDGAEVDQDLFKDFKRSLTWDISVPERTVLTLEFAGGLKELSGAENCQDGRQYSVITTKSDGKSKTKSYCRSGSVSHLDLLGVTTVATEVPKEGKLDSPAFAVKAAPRGGRMMSVTPDPDTRIIIKKVNDEPDCSVCKMQGSKKDCDMDNLELNHPTNTTVDFTCPRPQDVFVVEINRDIDCRETCVGEIAQTKSSLFSDFNRTFTWDLTVDSTRAFQLDLPKHGMRQIPNEETCPNKHTYSLITYLRTGLTTIGTFCKGGVVTTILVRYRGRLVLRVPADKKLDPVDYKLSVGPEISAIAIIKVDLPRGVSDTDFTTANYYNAFPDNEQMQWDFTVPGMHNYSITFNDHKAPECLKNEVEVLYQKKGKKETKLSLTDAQPQHQQGDFNMILKNCQTNRTLQGLTLNYKVSVMRSGHPVLCTVDLTKHQGVSLQLEKVGADPYCEMSIDSKVEKKIKVAAGTKASLSFLDCPNEDVRLTASKAMNCQNMASYSSTLLTVPKLDPCLPMPLHSFTWHLTISQEGTLDLTSPTGTKGLKQSLPGQECNQSVALHLAESDGFSVGDFCFNGAIQKIQVHTNISVTATTRDFKKTRGPFLNVSFSEEIPETFIFRVSPTPLSLTQVATPSWPQGMKPSSTVSWIVTLPSQYKANVRFANVSQPKCKDRHTAIKVKMLGQEEEILSRREDEQAEDLLVPHSFYLNMSNCIPEEGEFAAMTQIALQKKTTLMAILLGIAGAVLLLLIVLAVVCIVTKKKKRDQMNMESSIYIGKGNIFRPGDMHFTKTRSDNESHVYDSIDETMVYGHLLRDSSYSDSMQSHFNGMQMDSYQTFTGPTDGNLPVINEPDNEPPEDQYKTFLDPSESFLPPRPRTPIERQESLGFQDSRMVDNELYTFKSTGDINTIRLSGIDMDPQPPIAEESP